MKKLFLLPLIFFGVVLLALLGCTKKVDENPIVNSKKLVGEYKNTIATLIINIDQTYQKKGGGNIENGNWVVQDSSLTLTGSEDEITYIKVIEVEGLYQLIFLDRRPQDPDTWDWSRAMTRDGQNVLGSL